MKFSKLLQALLFGISFFKMGVTGDEGGGGAAAEGGAEGDAAAQAAAAKAGAGDEGGKKPSDEEARLLKEVMKKKDALTKAEGESAALKEQLKQFEGIDPVAIRALIADQKAAEDKQLEAKGEWERLKARMAEEQAKETGALKQTLAETLAELQRVRGNVDELSVGTQFGQSQFIATEMILPPAKARALYGDHFDLVDGKVVGFDKPRGAASRTALIDQYGNSVGFDDAMRRIIEADPEKDFLMKSKVKPGAGSDSKKVDAKQQQQQAAGGDSLSKIAGGLKGFKLTS